MEMRTTLILYERNKQPAATIPSRFPPPPEPKLEVSEPEPEPVVNVLTSPSLDALSSSKYASANEWAKTVPAFSGSPGNLINLGESPPLPSSPPTLPSSYEDRQPNFGWRTREQRGGYVASHPTAASPPTNRRPISFHMDGNYSHTPEFAHGRRSSMYSPPSQYSRMIPSNPPLPHQMQNHFYGAPQLDIMSGTPGLVSGDSGFYCGFDNLPLSIQDTSKGADNVVVTGYEGGVDIYAIGKRGLDRRARIDGIRGGVYNAKILLGAGGEPAIAVVVHGLVRSKNDAVGGDLAATPPSDGMFTARGESVRGSAGVPSPSVQEDDAIEYCQTTVEVYSLSSKQHISTLLALPEVPLSIPTTSPNFRVPSPVGSLTIRSDTNNLIVSSGNTGETWIFREKDRHFSTRKFVCIGKVWTSVQQGHAIDSTGLSGLADGDWHASDTSFTRQQFKAPILSLNGRWLAYCPSTPSSQISLRAEVDGVSQAAKVPGLNGQAPPQLPPINCGVEVPEAESVMKQFAQAMTQEFAKTATFIGKHGMKAWNDYWGKPSLNQASNGNANYQIPTNPYPQFPPTHGTSNHTPPVSKDPSLISIIDLDHLDQHSSSSGASPHPLATFKVPHGCSFISFAPSGLALFTASSKGDTQFVWDLMRVQYAKSSYLKGGSQGSAVSGPHARQIAIFTRMTIARVVDVVWTAPHGERAAMVTERGTVHILDLPASAFTWPPPRRRFPSKPEAEPAGTAIGAAGVVASSAYNSLLTAARPLVGRTRRSSTGISSISAASVKSQAGHGTQALAAGISRSVGAATGRMNELRKSGIATKLHLPHKSKTPNRACIRLSTGKRSDSVFVLGGGFVGVYTIKGRRADRPADQQRASKGAKYVEFRLPSLPDYKIAPGVVRDLELTDRDLEVPLLNPKYSHRETRYKGTESSIPQAEIESNAPYQPFHTDRRVALHVYSRSEDPPPSPSVSVLLSTFSVPIPAAPTARSNSRWAFGGPIKTLKLDVGPPQNAEDSFYVPSEHRAVPSSAIERVLRSDSSGDTEQIVVTTRIRKGARAGTDSTVGVDEEGFFEDDCEVLDFASQRV